MVVTPNTNITLLKTPFELDSLNQLTFSSKQAQYNYFNSLPKLSYDNATYQRKDGVIAFPTSPTGVTYEDLIQYNYCMYQNESYDDKWFYAYITKVTYDNNGMSYIEIETDVFQTWQFDITYKPSFIDREMLAKSDDIIGANTIPENLETGDYVVNFENKKKALTPLNVIMASNVDPVLDSNNELVGTNQSIIFSFGVEYVQADSNSTAVQHQTVGPVAPVTPVLGPVGPVGTTTVCTLLLLSTKSIE